MEKLLKEIIDNTFLHNKTLVKMYYEFYKDGSKREDTEFEKRFCLHEYKRLYEIGDVELLKSYISWLLKEKGIKKEQIRDNFCFTESEINYVISGGRTKFIEYKFDVESVELIDTKSPLGVGLEFEIKNNPRFQKTRIYVGEINFNTNGMSEKEIEEMKLIFHEYNDAFNNQNATFLEHTKGEWKFNEKQWNVMEMLKDFINKNKFNIRYTVNENTYTPRIMK